MELEIEDRKTIYPSYKYKELTDTIWLGMNLAKFVQLELTKHEKSGQLVQLVKFTKPETSG